MGIYLVDVETGSFTPIVEMPRGVHIGIHALWSLDGKAIFYTQHAADFNSIIKRNLESGKETELYHQELAATASNNVINSGSLSLGLSPDGRQLAFRLAPFPPTQAEGLCTLNVIPTAGGKPRELLRDSEEQTRTRMIMRPESLEWTPDGRYLLFVRDNGA